MHIVRLLLPALLLLGAAPAAAAQNKVQTELFTRVEDGQARAAIRLEIAEGWHLYHAELGHPDAVGKPTAVELSGAGIEWGPVVWPEPHRFPQEDFGEGVFILGHEGTVVLYAAGTLAEGASDDDVRAVLSGLTCKTLCVPYAADVQSSGRGPSEVFAGFQDRMASAAPTGSEAPPAPREDVVVSGQADADLYTRIDGDVVTAAIAVTIEPGWHLYHDDLSRSHPEAAGKPTQVTLHGEGITWGPVHFPEPHEVGQGWEWDDEEVWIHAHEGTIVLWAEGRLTPGVDPGPIHGEIEGQTCEDLCIDYAETFVSRGEGSDELFEEAGAAREAAGGAHGGALRPGGEEDDGLLAFLLLAIGGGLFALLMPCTYPMVPITISFFTKQADARGGSVLPLALAYGAGIILIFILIGVVIGPAIIPFATHPVTNFVIGAVFVLFALALFGVINIEPPRSLMNVAAKASMTGGYLGVFLMGMTLVVTSFTCTVPFVGSILSVGGAEGDLTRLVLGMAAFGATMAVPFVFLSLVPGRVQALPRSGEWMNTLKHFLGFVELAAALKFFSNTDLVLGWNVISRELFLGAWALLFLLAALYLVGLLRFKGTKPRVGAGRIGGALLSLGIAIYCFLGMRGAEMDKVMTAIAPPYSGGRFLPQWYAFDGGWTIVTDDYDEALRLARAEDKLLLVNFTGHT